MNELSSLQALLQNPSLVHAATHVNGFPFNQLMSRGQGQGTGNRGQGTGIWKASLSNNLKSQVRPRREFPPMLTTGSHMMRDELSQVLTEIQAITSRISSNFRQDTLAVLTLELESLTLNL
jgi:hypothetical protein